jgi:hypothetical protein
LLFILTFTVCIGLLFGGRLLTTRSTVVRGVYLHVDLNAKHRGNAAFRVARLRRPPLLIVFLLLTLFLFLNLLLLLLLFGERGREKGTREKKEKK